MLRAIIRCECWWCLWCVRRWGSRNPITHHQRKSIDCWSAPFLILFGLPDVCVDGWGAAEVGGVVAVVYKAHVSFTQDALTSHLPAITSIQAVWPVLSSLLLSKHKLHRHTQYTPWCVCFIIIKLRCAQNKYGFLLLSALETSLLKARHRATLLH